jgi:tRNA (cmo5U34)-methyltransferase
VQYDGIDSEPSFEPHWSTLRGPELTLRVADCRDYKYENISFAVALFIVQFLPPKDKVPFLRSLYSGMLPGSGLVIAEKVYAETGRMQDALTFPYYDQKLAHFTADEILDKERSLRGQMTLWTEAELRTNLQLVGFRDLELVWASFPFIAILALK